MGGSIATILGLMAEDDERLKKYVLKSNANGSTAERPLDDFTEDDFKKWQEGTLTADQVNTLQQQAFEDQNFEWWIEEVGGNEP